MPDLVAVAVAFISGLACACAIVAILRRRGAGEPVPTHGQNDGAVDTPTHESTIGDADGLERATDSLASELADLATGVEGHAQHLCEAIGDPEQVATQAQRLWANVRKLRLFSEKVVASCRPSAMKRIPTDVGKLLISLRQELEDYSGSGLQVKCEVASSLPRALVDPEGLRRTALFLIDSLLDLETDAGVLELRASNRVADDRANSIEVEIRLETENPSGDSRHPPSPLSLGFVAATRLVHGLGAEIALEHNPGLCTIARLNLEAAARGAKPPQAPSPAPQEQAHPFGGIVIVEDDPSVRSVVAREMEHTGRRVFCCADGAAARSLFAATPERFELLILDREARRQPGVVLATEAVSLSPGLKILLLGAEPRPGLDIEPDLGDRCRVLHKPFGVTELRAAVNGLLDAEVSSHVGA